MGVTVRVAALAVAVLLYGVACALNPVLVLVLAAVALGAWGLLSDTGEPPHAPH